MHTHGACARPDRLSFDRPDVKIRVQTHSARDPHDLKKIVPDKFPGLGIASTSTASSCSCRPLDAAASGSRPDGEAAAVSPAASGCRLWRAGVISLNLQ
jgi:hypothetical protein